MSNYARAPQASGQAGLARDLVLLQALNSPESRETGGLGVAQLADQIGRHKSQVSRALRALDEAGLVMRDPDTRRYRIGWQLYALAVDTGEARLLHAAREPMETLSSELDVAVHLCALDNTEVVTLLSVVRSANTATYLGSARVPAYCTSAGRVLLSDYTRARLEKRFRSVAIPTSEPSARVRSVEDLHATIHEARAVGYATVDEELKPELVGASAPVRSTTGRVIAAINISAAKARLTDLDHAGRAAVATASAISRSMGWSPRQSATSGPT